MRQLRFIFIAFLASLFVINANVLQKAVAVLLCGVLSFNSASCYGFLNQGEIVNATTPPAKQIDLTGSWTIKRPWTRVDSKGCTAQNPPGVSGDYTGEFKVIQEGKQFQFAPEMVGNGVTLKGSVDERKISFVYTTSTGGVHEAVGTISADGNTVTSEALCSSSRGPATVREKFIWTRKSCPQFQAMLREAEDIQKLADTLERDDKAYNAAVIDIVLRGYSSPYAVYMLDVPPEEIPELFKDNQQIRAVRSQIIDRIGKKAENRKMFADIGISGKFMPETPVYSKENIELFCTLDSSKFTKEFWDSLWMAGYIDYNLYTQVENQLIVYGYKNYFETLADIATLPVAEATSLSLYVFKVGFKNLFLRLTELAVGVIKQIQLKVLPRLTIKQVSTVLPEGIAMTFKDGEYINRLTQVEETFYRYHGKSNLSGNEYVWFTNKKYTSEEEVRNGLAIAKEWGIELDSISKIRVPKNTWVSEGKAASQIELPGGGFKYPGGEYQAVIKNIPKDWVITNTEKAW